MRSMDTDANLGFQDDCLRPQEASYGVSEVYFGAFNPVAVYYLQCCRCHCMAMYCTVFFIYLFLQFLVLRVTIGWHLKHKLLLTANLLRNL